MIRFKCFTGGALDTNCFFLQCPEGNLLIDAPDGALEAFADEEIHLLALTHGHYDHVSNAAALARVKGCRIAYHADTAPLVETADAFRRHGFALDIEPFKADFLIEEGPARRFLGLEMDALLVPGHCPGSLCFLHKESGNLFGGDVLFAGGVGRWDLPGGNGELLFKGIREKILPLPDATRVHPGHGPSTTIGEERATNPYLRNL